MPRYAPALLVLALLVHGCGQDDPPARLPAVELRLTAPSDGAVVREESVEVTGQVEPADARVSVQGTPATVSDGRFSTTVPLGPGANVIDVSASADEHRSIADALRVVREVPVEIPEVDGESPDDAVRILEDLGLEVEVRRRGGLIDELIPRGLGVCGTDPAGGSEVPAGSRVVLEVSRLC